MKDTKRVAELLAELRTLAETPLEIAIVDRCEKDLPAPPKVEIINDKHQRFLGMTFYLNKAGHFKGNVGIHHVVWAYYFGEIPPLHEMHHVDENKANNTLSNLQCLTKAEHRERHDNFSKTKTYVCEQCGKVYEHPRICKHRFCSKECELQARHDRYQEMRTCKVCGNSFYARRDTQQACCSRSCAAKLRCRQAKETHQTPKKRIPENIRAKIRQLYIKGDKEFGVKPLARKFGINPTTVLKIVRENQ